MRLLGTVCDESKRLQQKFPEISNNIPDTFDARSQWPQCPSIGFIRDQGSCRSSWAVASVTAMSDRICIASKGSIKVNLSAEDLMSCCHDCGYGCDGGFPSVAWKYWESEGIVTGGGYQGDGCEPYSIPPCEHLLPSPRPSCKRASSPKCKKQCALGYQKQYAADKIQGNAPYSVNPDSRAIQNEIFTNGPVQASIDVFNDFPDYKSGKQDTHEELSSASILT